MQLGLSVRYLLLFVLLIGLNASAKKSLILGLSADSPLRPARVRLSSMTGVSFKEGMIRVPKSKRNNTGWRASIAFKEPSYKKPIFMFLPGATQDKTSYAALIRDILDADKDLGILALDFFGQGESLDDAIPLAQDIPVEANAFLVEFLHSKMRAKYRKSPIVLVGISYGSGVALTAAFHSKQIRAEMKISKTRMVIISFGEEAAIVTNQINLQAGLLKLFWPTPKTGIKPFRDAFTRYSIFTQAALAEPVILKQPFPWTLEANFRILAGLGNMQFDKLGKILPKKSLDVILSFEDAYLDLSAIAARYKKWPAVSSMMLMTDADHKINRSTPLFLAHWLLNLTQVRKRPSGVFYGDPMKSEVLTAKDCRLVRTYPKGKIATTEEIWGENIQSAYNSWFYPGAINPFTAWWQMTYYYWWQQYQWMSNQWISIWTQKIDPKEFWFVKKQDLAFIIDQYGKLQMGFLKQMTDSGQNKVQRDKNGRIVCK